MKIFSCYQILRLFIILCTLNICSGVKGQLCNGSLGDPVVNITFGKGAASNSTVYSPPNTYIYTSSTCPNDGYYTITPSTSGCFGNTWHTVATDHTGGGNFMLVNASYQPGDFFLATVNDLCPNTTYEFAAWLMNVLVNNGIKPNVTFTIEKPDGTVLGQFSTGNIVESAGPVWKQYGLYFTTPPGNASIVLRITNNAPGGMGNDIALDDITFRPCGPPVTVTAQGGKDTIDVCEGNTTSFTFESSISPVYLDPVYYWQLSRDSGVVWNDMPGTNTAVLQQMPSTAGSYWYRIAVTEASAAAITSCRIASNVIIINVHPKPVVNAGPDRVLIKGDSITLSAKVEGEPLFYNWSPSSYLSDNSLLDPVASPPADVIYRLDAESSYGCSANSDDVLVKVINGIYIPSAFTPNGDGINDIWKIPFLDPEWGVSVKVFNRSGQLVYQANGPDVSWDGTFKSVPLDTGAFVYVVSLKATHHFFKGTVTLIR